MQNILSISLILVFLAFTSGCTLKRGEASLDGGIEPSTRALAFQSNESFGEELNTSDRLTLSEAEARALEFGKANDPMEWRGNSQNVSGVIVVSQPFRVGQSSCRRFSHKLVIEKNEETAGGTACRRNSGPWRLIK